MPPAFDPAAPPIRPDKKLGQNFLIDTRVVDRIAQTVGIDGRTELLEIGPGPGALTEALLRHGPARLLALEKDERAVAHLQTAFSAHPALEVASGDAVAIPLGELYGRFSPGAALKIVSNLPYNVGTRIFERLMVQDGLPAAWPPRWASMTLMFQREVAMRMIAEPGSGAFGTLSVLSQWRTDAMHIMDVAPEAFVPAPKVTSSVLYFVPRAAPEGVTQAGLDAVLRSAFAAKRKALRGNLSGAIKRGLDVDDLIGKADRPQDVDVATYVEIARRAASL